LGGIHYVVFRNLNVLEGALAKTKSKNVEVPGIEPGTTS
jgi:hypothetical protein